MARITVEDCLEQVDNRFNLVLIASKRARQISRGKEPHVAAEQDKATVIALREVAAGFITTDILTEDEVDPMDAFETAEELLVEEAPIAEIEDEDEDEDLAAKLEQELAKTIAAEKPDDAGGE